MTLDESGHLITEGRPPTDEENMLVDYGIAQFKQTVSNAKDTLGKFLTLDMALIGGTFALIKNSPFPFGCTITILILLACSLSASFYGLWPWGSNVYVFSPESVYAWHCDVVARKKRALTYTAMFFFAALITAIVGVIVKGG